jgi:hypothetical protein
MEDKAKAIKIVQDHDDDTEEKQKKPPKKVTKNSRGQLRDYNFLKTVKSVEEVDNFRFEVI